jgi:hypothetical protein
MSLNPPHFTLTNTNSMPTSVMISLLRKGNNGNEILQILDSICEDSEQQNSTANVVDFSGAPVTDF